MFSNMSLFVFVVGIYGHSARIYRFDHAGAIVSCSFNYVTDPQLLGQFYWRLVHPIVDSTPSIHNRFIVGSDTTVKRRCIFDLLIPQAVSQIVSYSNVSGTIIIFKPDWMVVMHP